MKRTLIILSLILPIATFAQTTEIFVQDTTLRYYWQNENWQPFSRTVYADFQSSGIWKSATQAFFDTLNSQWYDSIYIKRTFYTKDQIETYLSYILTNQGNDTLEFKKYDQYGNILIDQTKNANSQSGSKITTRFDENGRQLELKLFTLENNQWKLSLLIQMSYIDTLLSEVKYFWPSEQDTLTLGYLEKYFYSTNTLDSIYYYEIYATDSVLNKKQIFTEYIDDGLWKEYIIYLYFNDEFVPFEKYWRSNNTDTVWAQHWYNGQWIDTVEYKIYDHGNLTTYIWKKWYLNTPNPAYGSKQIFVYNNDLQVQNLTYYLQGTNWIPSTKQVKVFNDFSLPVAKRIYTWNQEKNLWILDNEYLYDYDQQRLVSFTYYTYYDGTTPIPQLKELYLWHSYLTNIANTANTLTIYPVPAHDRLFIKSDISIKNIQVLDISGKTVIHNQHSTDNQINISNLTPGIYTIVINNQYTKKFIKY